MQNDYTVRINFLGGLVSPGDLSVILEQCERIGIRQLRFGQRQQLIIHVPTHYLAEFSASLGQFKPQINDNRKPNIVSSYAGEEIFQQGNWLTEGIYKDVFDGFEHESKLKVNISDEKQSFTPYFSGHLNFIASDIPNFWYLVLRFPKTNEVYEFNKLVITTEIGAICAKIEDIMDTGERGLEKIWKSIEAGFVFQEPKNKLRLHPFRLPYYEGLNRYGRKSWLGLYSRDERFSVAFLQELCAICLQTKIGQFCITNWKSIIVKGIEELDRGLWSSFLSKFNINIRHAANELNWQVEDDAELAITLKNQLSSFLNKIDLRTFGLAFGIKTIPKTEVFASIMIQKKKLRLLGILPLWSLYDISYTEDFDPNGRTKRFFARNIPFFNLKEQLRRVVLLYNQIVANNAVEQIQEVTPEADAIVLVNVHKCKICYTVYDPKYGDVLNNIEPGLPFDSLGTDFACSVCGEKEFETMEYEERSD